MIKRSWHVRAYCQCGWNIKSPFDVYQEVCPDCGSPWGQFTDRVVRYEALPKRKWWHLTKYRLVTKS